MQVDVSGIRTSRDRLDTLSRGLAKEVVLIKEDDGPLLYLERRPT